MGDDEMKDLYRRAAFQYRDTDLPWLTPEVARPDRPGPDPARPPVPGPGPASSRCRLTLRIGASDYRVRPLRDPGPGAVRGWRLRKLDDGARHVVAETGDGPACDCEDHVYRRHPCKHIRACRALGLIR